jgi:hypothetical protein
VRRRKFDEIKKSLKTTAGGQAQPQGSAEVYYLTKGGIDRPLYDFWVAAANPEGPAKISSLLELTAKQENLRALSNVTSPLNNRVRLTVLRVTGTVEANGSFKTTKEEARPLDQMGTSPFTLGEHYRFRVENTSDRDLFITLIVLGTSGGVRILNDGKAAVQVPRGRSADFPCSSNGPLPCLEAGPPLGVETYKVIATTSDVDFRFIEQEGAKAKSLIISPLQWLVSQASSGQSKDPLNVKAISSDSWTTAQIDLLIKDNAP